MPAVTKCLCGYDGNHGFTEGKPWGRYYYHGEVGVMGGKVCGFYEYNGTRYKTELLAFKAYRKHRGYQHDPLWLDATEARIMGDTERADRLQAEFDAIWQERIDRQFQPRT